jgi:hypothetical protein
MTTRVLVRTQSKYVNNSPVGLSPSECTTHRVVKGYVTYDLVQTLNHARLFPGFAFLWVGVSSINII